MYVIIFVKRFEFIYTWKSFDFRRFDFRNIFVFIREYIFIMPLASKLRGIALKTGDEARLLISYQIGF